MAKRRRLADLYVCGQEITFDDGQGAVGVWIQAINTPEQEIAHRKASARRAVVSMDRHDPTSENYLAIRDEVEDLDLAFVVEYLAADELFEREAAVEAEQAATEEWAKDAYLVGLRDAWEPPEGDQEGLKDAWAADQSDPEAARVFAELKRFAEQVAERVEPYAELRRAELAVMPEDELRRRCTEKFLETKAALVYSEELRRCQMWLGTRELDDHRRYYFEAREEIEGLPEEVFRQLRAAHLALSVPGTTGKDSRGATSSSPSSEPSAEAETAPSAGLAAALA